jgi:AcrR family transcriptional regulator
MIPTRQRLLLRARELFNEHGLERIGVRELARDLGLSPGNVSYYFARKEDLVRALMDELRELNDRTFSQYPREPTLEAFLRGYRVMFANHHEYRFLQRAIVHLVEAYPELADEYGKTERTRRRGLAETMAALRDAGELGAELDERGIARLVGMCSLVSRFWLSEYRVSYEGEPLDRVIAHYLALLAQAFLPVATARGRAALLPYLDGVLTGPSSKRGKRG